ncbi:MAG: hypothetical protein M1816_001388 [Peltula sp. TS41687]|nr:MAG: hypothetical protein M1816_001388 [Peltula sp. TS41687]
MPLPILAEGLFNGLSSIPYSRPILKSLIWLGIIYLLKTYFGGARNTSERMMHSKVVMITGGTSGIGASIARALAQRGAQIILLTHHPPSDAFLVDYVEDLRRQTSNQMIYAEQVDLASLHSIRLFATKWIDNAPPRRLDKIILCANTLRPPFSKKEVCTVDGVETNWAVNYLANFHLLSILSPAIRAQPPDRDVRIIMGTCSSYIGGDILSMRKAEEEEEEEEEEGKPSKGAQPSTQRSSSGSTSLYGTSKLALMIFGQNFQKHLDAYVRPDKQPNMGRVIMVDPGWTRTPGMRHWLSAGSLWGLLFYLITWPFWWLVLKSPDQGAQSFLYAAMDAGFGRGDAAGGKFIKECREVDYARKEICDEGVGKELWEASEKQIEGLEKEGAVRRAKAKKETRVDEVVEDEDGEAYRKDDTATNTASSRKPGSRRSRKAG